MHHLLLDVRILFFLWSLVYTRPTIHFYGWSFAFERHLCKQCHSHGAHYAEPKQILSLVCMHHIPILPGMKNDGTSVFFDIREHQVPCSSMTRWAAIMCPHMSAIITYSFIILIITRLKTEILTYVVSNNWKKMHICIVKIKIGRIIYLIL